LHVRTCGTQQPQQQQDAQKYGIDAGAVGVENRSTSHAPESLPHISRLAATLSAITSCPGAAEGSGCNIAVL
jgi:hypothetical protein